jgi:hypothetical protein
MEARTGQLDFDLILSNGFPQMHSLQVRGSCYVLLMLPLAVLRVSLDLNRPLALARW